MDNFAAIDFETANYTRSSVCSVGVVIVRNGAISDEIYRLIHPEPDYYIPQFTAIHGLTAQDTAKAPLFPEVWAEIAPLVKGLTLVAHNSPFDEGCLKAAFAAYGMRYPAYRFLCTCRAARFNLNLPDNRLPTVARACGYDLTKHHNAIADAEACAHIALRLL